LQFGLVETAADVVSLAGGVMQFLGEDAMLVVVVGAVRLPGEIRRAEVRRILATEDRLLAFVEKLQEPAAVIIRRDFGVELAFELAGVFPFEPADREMDVFETVLEELIVAALQC